MQETSKVVGHVTQRVEVRVVGEVFPIETAAYQHAEDEADLRELLASYGREFGPEEIKLADWDELITDDDPHGYEVSLHVGDQIIDSFSGGWGEPPITKQNCLDTIHEVERDVENGDADRWFDTISLEDPDPDGVAG